MAHTQFRSRHGFSCVSFTFCFSPLTIRIEKIRNQVGARICLEELKTTCEISVLYCDD